MGFFIEFSLLNSSFSVRGVFWCECQLILCVWRRLMQKLKVPNSLGDDDFRRVNNQQTSAR